MPDGSRFAFPPRLMRASAAAHYLGMSESCFRATVAPELREVRIGGIVGWLREDLDGWLDARAGRAAQSQPEANPWHQ
ncbi:transcriptional regulator [Roseococcus sp. SDR]|uniref:helix-turn-helix transcriptional regulator n=1 Tax=Roseococcus sp. SDR TaxID=2835532 RepID=UPI001BCB55A6|nr:transcriptional regulator [Roseococcus sp. SDR]MBS7789237.1 transcriptional regulator [Roseococcus sp. SDR]MBV1844551.1 transcriptional regulator [Roseococcus sp. SDR]